MEKTMHRILVIDDTQAIHDDFRKVLSQGAALSNTLQDAKAALFQKSAVPKAARPAFDVEHALQGEEGWNKLKVAVAEQRPFSVAFVDMRMPPGWDGLHTIERLWEADPELQVVVCTAFSDHSWEEISEKLGLTDRLLILKKPFDPIEVIQLATALSEKWVLKRQAALRFDDLERLVQLRTSALEHAASHDKLTGLPNRALLRERLVRTIERSREQPGEAFAVLFLDFDRFKVVNDSLGHDAGDQLLIEIGRRMTACLASDECASWCRETLAARMGGDEFVVLVEGLHSTQGACHLAESLLKQLAEPYALKGYNLTTTASIGLTTSELAYENPDDALRDADTAMYHAKAAGKARYVVFDRRMHQAAKDRLLLETELRGVVERNELVLHYQPVICMATGALKGFEALVRWNRTGHGIMAPEEFIAAAEETGVIVPLGEWVLKQACAQLHDWNRRFSHAKNLVVNVNVSAKQLISPQLLDHIKSALDASGLEPGSLALEITESAVISDPDFNIDLLHRIKALGVQIYLDDFGTGYTSLSYLHRLPLDGLKMDQSFMSSVSERRDYAAIVHAIITLSQNLGITVVAEGVETRDQVAMLQSMECDDAQGFFFGHPVDAEQTEALLARLTMPIAA
jgi:diguanylate cyclase